MDRAVCVEIWCAHSSLASMIFFKKWFRLLWSRVPSWEHTAIGTSDFGRLFFEKNRSTSYMIFVQDCGQMGSYHRREFYCNSRVIMGNSMGGRKKLNLRHVKISFFCCKSIRSMHNEMNLWKKMVNHAIDEKHFHLNYYSK